MKNTHLSTLSYYSPDLKAARQISTYATLPRKHAATPATRPKDGEAPGELCGREAAPSSFETIGPQQHPRPVDSPSGFSWAVGFGMVFGRFSDALLGVFRVASGWFFEAGVEDVGMG